MYTSVLHAENVAMGGQTECFQNVGGGGEGAYDVLTLHKSLGGARTHLGGTFAPPRPSLNAALHVSKK